MTLAPLGPGAPAAPHGEPRDPAAGEVDLRRAPLATVRTLDFRAEDRDFPADERAMWSRFSATWAGLDDAAWRYPGAAPSDAGGPDWSFLDHVAHVAAWQELALDYIALAVDGAPWPTDADFEGGDFDRYNERLRDPWAAIEPAAIRDAHRRLARPVGRARRRGCRSRRSARTRPGSGSISSSTAISSTTSRCSSRGRTRSATRQAEGDPFPVAGSDTLADPAAPIASFWAAEASIGRLFDETVRPVPADAWEIVGPTEGWTLKDHVGHLAAWFDRGGRGARRPPPPRGLATGAPGRGGRLERRAPSSGTGGSRRPRRWPGSTRAGRGCRPRSGPCRPTTSAIRKAGAGRTRTCTVMSARTSP